MTTTANINAKGTNGTGITEDLAKTLHDNLGKSVMAVVEIRSENRTESLNGDEKVNLIIQTIEPAPDSNTETHLRELARAFHYERKLAETGPTLPMPGESKEPTVEEVTRAGARHTPHAPVLDGDSEICEACELHKGAPIHTVQEQLGDAPEDTDEQTDDAADDDGIFGTADTPVIVDVADIGAPGWIDRLRELTHAHDSNGRCLKNSAGPICVFTEPDEADPEPATPDDPAYDPHLFVDGHDETDTCALDGCGQPEDATIHDVDVPATVGG